MSQKIMSWSRQTVKIGRTGSNDAIATNWVTLDAIKDKSVTMEREKGDSLEAKETGGRTIAYEENDGKVTISMTLYEPDFSFLSNLLGASVVNNDLELSSWIVPDNWSIEVSPKNVGGTGVRARKCAVTANPAFSEDEGNSVELTFTILECASGVPYVYFKKTSGAQLSITPASGASSVSSGGTATHTVVVRGTGLSGNVTLTVNDTDSTANYFTADKSTLTPSSGEVNSEVVITYQNGASGSHTGILTATNGTASASATWVVTEAAS